MDKYILILMGVNEFGNPMLIGHEFADKPADDDMKASMVKKAANGGLNAHDFEDVFRPQVESIKLP